MKDAWETLCDDIPMGVPFEDFMLAYKYAHSLAVASTCENAVDDLNGTHCVEYTMSVETRSNVPYADGDVIASATYADGSGEVALIATAGFLAVYDVTDSPFILSKVSYVDGNFILDGIKYDATDIVDIIARN